MELAQLLQSTALLLGALFVLVKGADFFVDGSKKIGSALGMSPFAVGVLIVGVGTSLPEFASSLAAVLAGSSEIVIANVVGSNITNILLIIGVIGVLGGPILIKKDLLKTELPIFLIATVHFVASVYDGVIDKVESALLVGTFIAYVWYLFSANREEKKQNLDVEINSKITSKDLALVIFGIAGVLVGAHYTVLMAVDIATGLAVPLSLISIGAIAVGTSLPELFVSVQAIRNGDTELAIGNIFGSNSFNILMVIGIPGLIMPLMAGEVVMKLGLSVLVAASLILFVIGLARQVQRWEGVAMLIFFSFFVVKLVAFV